MTPASPTDVTVIVPGALAVASDLAANLARHAAQAQGAYATNTERALRADIAVFTTWCASAGLASLPATPDTVAGFIDAMAEEKASATIRRYVSSIATFHRAAGLDSPTSSLTVRLALKRLHRAKGRAQLQARPLNRKLVDKMLDAGGAGLWDLRNRALLALAYDTLCRRSELVAIDVGDLEIGADGNGTVMIRRSKTDQEGVGAAAFVAADTVAHITRWLVAAAIQNGPLLRSVGKGNRVGGPISPGDVARVFKAMATAAGVPDGDVAGIAGHSSRVGSAQDMIAVGIELPLVMQSGRWRSAEMVARYTRRLDARRSGAAKLAVLQDRA